ncbi:AMP-dependent synthetase [Actinophytocola xinjiangensis]|uniref:AMP-dependent synthetase n=1 Tax=Actinophytocola xinjiangensis TaxID=485602 RepID=A0A7Z0WEX4_9PSEU|nr:AMP-binding protein [Actinophytocola xinjiangensis]OLF05242.1 AMP-dependent synthetase [Actinophytocola xinjiangensis]
MNPRLLHHLLDDAERRTPHAPAVTAAGHTLSYTELADASRSAASALVASGVRRGDRVVALLPSSLPLVALVYGCSRAGAAFVVLHEQVRGAALRHVLTDAEPALLVTADEDAADLAATLGVPVRSPEDLACPFPAAPPDRAIAVDPVCLIYTSGSTGLPKAVVSTHAQLLFATHAIAEVLGYRADDVVWLQLPLSFDYGLYQLFLAAVAGAHVSVGSPGDLGPILLANLRRSRATVLPAVPSLADNLATMLERYGADLPLRLVTNTGAAMHQDTLARLRAQLPSLRVRLMFGLTECKRATIMPADEDLRRPGACGVALPGTEILILDDHGAPLPPGEIGEIVVRGPHVMAGYWRRPDLTAHRFRLADNLFPQLHTGDYGWLDPDGYLYFDGRRDDLYKSAGYRVSATEVEAAARRIDGVTAAAVVPPGPDRRHPVLFVVTDLPPETVLTRMAEEIEPYKIPPTCRSIPSLPLTTNGKIDREALATSLLTS